MKLFAEIVQVITGLAVFSGFAAFIWWSVTRKNTNPKSKTRTQK